MRLPILALAVSAFAIGTTEFVVMGLLPRIAVDLRRGHSLRRHAGHRLCAGRGVRRPLMAMATARMPHKTVLLALMGMFVAGNLLCALAPNYQMLMAARVIAALAHGSFFGAGAVVAASHRRTRQLRTRSMRQANDAPLLASTLNQSAFNPGNVRSASLGARLLSHGGDHSRLGLIAPGATAIGLMLTVSATAWKRASAAWPLPIATPTPDHPRTAAPVILLRGMPWPSMLSP